MEENRIDSVTSSSSDELQGRKKIRNFKKLARLEGSVFLTERKNCDSPAARKAFRKKWNARKKEWKASLKTLSPEERKIQKKGYASFRKRIHRTRRCISWTVVLALLLCLVYFSAPIVQMFLGLMQSQKYTDTGTEAEIARANGYLVSQEICDEGFVLLKNDGDLLPLQSRKINIFGDDAYNFVYGGSGSAGADQSGAATLFEAFDKAGIEYNRDLDAAYQRMSTATGAGSGSVKEMLLSYFTGKKVGNDWHLPDSEAIAQAKDFSDQALIVLSSQEVETAEIETALLQPMQSGSNKSVLIDQVCSEFEHVILIINSGNIMELGFVRDYDSIDAVLWVGAPGSQGCGEIAKVLCGEINPSGRTVDTWPVNLELEPSFVTYGSNYYANLSDLHTMNYSEGIYVGYRYYETRFGGNEDEYSKNVVFPFGYGLSYTRFTETISGFQSDENGITVDVTVKNIGKTAGKNIVELYFMPPWNEGSPEKSAIELAGFAKTELLQPKESVTVTISFPIRDMASWSTEKGGYLLESGDYRICIGKNVHAALTARSFETYSVEEDILYTTDETTGTELQNRFAFASDGLTTLSRTDWEATWPTYEERPVASNELKHQKADYEKAYSAYATLASPIQGAENEIRLADLKGLNYEDPLWEKFLDEFTVEEMIRLMANGGWHTIAIDRLGVPAARLLDGPSGINSMMTKLNAAGYPAETIVSSTWNTDLAAKLGNAVAQEAAAYGVNGWYAPAVNIHRLSIGGRNSEYYSEDPLLSGNMSAATIQAAQDGGLVVFVKHFVCNDVELNARNNLCIWVDEQALREIYLRPFEIAVKEGNASGIMSSFSRLGVKWCGGSSELLKDVLRTEWGFRGVVSTDACLGNWMNAELAAKNGNSLMLEMGLQRSEKVLEHAYKKDPIGIAWSLRDTAHDICYSLVNYTNLF